MTPILFWVGLIWIVLSVPVALLVGQFIHHGNGED